MRTSGRLMTGHRKGARAGRRSGTVLPALCFAACLLAVIIGPPAYSAVVATVDGRLEGELSIAADTVTIGGQAVKWEDVLFLAADTPMTVAPAPHAVRLTSGEIWAVEIAGLAEGKLELHSALFGRRELNLDQVRAIDFLPGLPDVRHEKARVMYRYPVASAGTAEPVPGTILWIDRDRAAIDTVLGALTISRAGLKRYVFDRRRVDAEGDRPHEITLADGSVLRARLVPGDDGRLVIEHPVLGALHVRTGALRSVLRRDNPSVVFLADVEPASVETFPFISRHAAAPSLAAHTTGVNKPRPYVRVLLVRPKTIIEYSLPERTGRKLSFRARLSPAEGSLGAVHVRISVGDDVVFDRELGRDKAEPVDVSLELPEGVLVSIEVDFGSTVRFPCRVALADAYLILQ